ncbi:HPr family phosphocarrier protein [Vallitalea pronyensis]
MMVRETVTIVNKTGLHARPANAFVKVSKDFACDIFLEKDTKKMNGKSILGLLSLGLNQGSQVDIIADGEDEQQALETLVNLVKSFTE